jgi:hypothetical protein
MFNLDEEFMQKCEAGEATEEEILEAIKGGLAWTLDLFEHLEHMQGGRLSGRFFSIARTELQTGAMFLIAEDAESVGSSITDGLRGI